MDNISFEEFYAWLDNGGDYDGPVGLSAKFYVKEDQVSQFRQVMNNNLEHSLGEKGVRLYKMQADFKDSNIFWLIEEWDSVSDLRAHCQSETFKKNEGLMTSLMEVPICQIGLYKLLC